MVGSNDALRQTINTLMATGGPAAWRNFIRQDSLKVFIPITDDSSSANCGTPEQHCTGAWFDQVLLSTGGAPFGDS
jgi:hypothetical protein